jgi:hypothetical protein
MDTFKSTEIYLYKPMRIIYDNWDEMPEDLRDGRNHIGNGNLKELVRRYLDKAVPTSNPEIYKIDVSYKHSNMLKVSGRQYAKGQLSLQSMTRKIRHTITKGLYNDIDMKNAHLSILNQYCSKKGWTHTEIKKSVKNNEEYLKDIMDADGVNRGEAKKLKLSVSYGSDVTSKAKWFTAFKNEVKQIHKNMIEDKENKQLIKKIALSKGDHVEGTHKFEVYNMEGKLCGHIMCDIENKILMACMDYLKKKKIPTDNVVLIFDGFMIPKDVFDGGEKILSRMSKYVFKKTGYEMTFVNKPQDEFLTLEGLSIKGGEEIVIHNDVEACEEIIKCLEGRIYLCENELYVKNERNVWTSAETHVTRYITRCIVKQNIVTINNSGAKVLYSKSVDGISKIIKLIKSLCPSNDKLIEEIRKNSKGKLFFNNGVYEFSEGKLRKETDDDMTTIRIDRDYDTNIDKTIKKKLYGYISDIFDTEEEIQNFLRHGARALAGHIEDKRFILGTGLRNCGKGIITLLFGESFPKYVTEADANNFINVKRIGSTDESKNKMWLMSHMWSRIMFCNEADVENGKDECILNGALIKSLTSGGDTIRARNLYSSETQFKFGARIILFMNHTPTIKPVDTCQQMSTFLFPHKFVEKEEGEKYITYERKTIANLKDILKDKKYLDAFTELVFSNYTDTPVKDCETVKKNTSAYLREAGDVMTFYKEAFTYGDERMVTPTVKVYETVKSVFKEVTRNQVNTFMTVNMKLESSRMQYVDEDGDKMRAMCYIGISINKEYIDELELELGEQD